MSKFYFLITLGFYALSLGCVNNNASDACRKVIHLTLLPLIFDTNCVEETELNFAVRDAQRNSGRIKDIFTDLFTTDNTKYMISIRVVGKKCDGTVFDESTPFSDMDFTTIGTALSVTAFAPINTTTDQDEVSVEINIREPCTRYPLSTRCSTCGNTTETWQAQFKSEVRKITNPDSGKSYNVQYKDDYILCACQ